MKDQYVGIVLSASSIGEYDKRVVLLTRENGCFSAFARGARRPKSSLSAVTEPFCFGEFFVYRGRDSYTIEEVRAVEFFPDLRNDLDKLYMGLYACEVAEYFSREGMRADAELELLYRTLMAISGSGTGEGMIPLSLIRRIYEVRTLAIAGYAPMYDEEKKVWIEGGSIPWKLSESAAYTIGQILSRPLPKLYGFSVSEAVLAELENTVSHYFSRNTDKKFHSLDPIIGV